MDPLTATQNAIAAVFQFLSSPAGQDVIQDFRRIDAAFAAKLKDLFDKLHDNAKASTNPSSPAA